jgi:hypothetical protein
MFSARYRPATIVAGINPAVLATISQRTSSPLDRIRSVVILWSLKGWEWAGLFIIFLFIYLNAPFALFLKFFRDFQISIEVDYTGYEACFDTI